MIRDLNGGCVWCDLWGNEAENASKTKTMILSRSRTVHSQSTPLTLDGTVLRSQLTKLYLG